MALVGLLSLYALILIRHFSFSAFSISGPILRITLIGFSCAFTGDLLILAVVELDDTTPVVLLILLFFEVEIGSIRRSMSIRSSIPFRILG